MSAKSCSAPAMVVLICVLGVSGFRGCFSVATVGVPTGHVVAHDEDEEMIEVPPGCSANPDLRVGIQYRILYNESEITLEVQCAGKEQPHHTVRITDKGKETFFNHRKEFKRFFKLDFAKEVPPPKSTSDSTKYIYQCAGNAAPFKCKACTENGLFTTCVIYPYYLTKSVRFACVNCFLCRRADSCEHNPDRIASRTNIGGPLQSNDLVQSIPLAYGVKAVAPAATTISSGQIRALHAIGLVIAPAGSIPQSEAPRSQRQADERCQQTVSLINHHLAAYQKRHRGEPPLLRIVDTLEEAAFVSTEGSISLASSPEPVYSERKVKTKPLKAIPSSNKRSQPDSAIQPLSKESRVALAQTASTTASLPAPITASHLQRTGSSTLISPASAIPSQAPSVKDKSKKRKRSGDKKGDGKSHKHHKTHSSIASTAAENKTQELTSFGENALVSASSQSVSQEMENLTSISFSSPEVDLAANNANATTNTIATADGATEGSGSIWEMPATPVSTPLQTPKRYVPKSRPVTAFKEPLPRPRYNSHNPSPLKQVSNVPVTSEVPQTHKALSSTNLALPEPVSASSSAPWINVDKGASHQHVSTSPNAGRRVTTTSGDSSEILQQLSASNHQRNHVAADSKDTEDDSDDPDVIDIELFQPKYTLGSSRQFQNTSSPKKVSSHGIIYANATAKNFSDAAARYKPLEEVLARVPSNGIIFTYRKGSLSSPMPRTSDREFPLGYIDDDLLSNALHLLEERLEWRAQVVQCSNQYFAMASQEHQILQGSEWFDDIIISCYLFLLHNAYGPRPKRLFTWIDSVFADDILRRRGSEHPLGPEWSTRTKELRSARFVLIPVNTHHHWVLVVIDKKSRSFAVGDSNSSTDQFAFARKLIDPILHFLRSHEAIPLVDGTDTWEYLGNFLPQQENTYDCGAFVCAGAKLVLETGDISRKLSFKQEDVTAFRTQMLVDLINGHALSFNPLPSVTQLAIDHERSGLLRCEPGSTTTPRKSKARSSEGLTATVSSHVLPAAQTLAVNRRLTFSSVLSLPSTPVTKGEKLLSPKSLRVGTNVLATSPLPATADARSSLLMQKENAPPVNGNKVPFIHQLVPAKVPSLTKNSLSPRHQYRAPSNPLSTEMIDELDGLLGEKENSSVSLLEDGCGDSAAVACAVPNVPVDNPCIVAYRDNGNDLISKTITPHRTDAKARLTTTDGRPSSVLQEPKSSLGLLPSSSGRHPFFKPAKFPVGQPLLADPNPAGLTPEEKFAYDNITPEEGRSIMTIPIHKFPMLDLSTSPRLSEDVEKPIKQEPSSDDNVLNAVPAVDDNYVVYQPKPRKAPKPPRRISSAWIVGVSKNWGRRKRAGPYEGVYRKQHDTDSICEIAKSQWTAVNAHTTKSELSPPFREVRWGIDPHPLSSKKHPFFKPATIKVPVNDTRPIDTNPEGLTPEERYAYENITPEEGRSMMTIPIHKFPMPELPNTSTSSVDTDRPIKQEPSTDDNVLNAVPAVDDNYVVYQPKPRKAPKPPRRISSAWIVGVSKNWGRRKKAGPYEGVYRKQRKR
ncbi:Peptidase C48, SUMO/Sentrin/Ubl1 [Ascosphaera apis ARSEF 7405]|uniref:Peptidase C48, SUMO/Sentrin/Ubl1 n=1 Tax=Ascosphaera apis ARSEF 7405 TaxID=392613 RepID=A0A167USY5_9EURO|nr:Peptidase C48, SUMO/Sentrin/Ubl1 [Ascosphaera apis ARSEF 7405]